MHIDREFEATSVFDLYEDIPRINFACLHCVEIFSICHSNVKTIIFFILLFFQCIPHTWSTISIISSASKLKKNNNFWMIYFYFELVQILTHQLA